MKYSRENKNFYGVLDEKKFNDLKVAYGECKIDVPVPSYFILFVDEIFHPFFLF